MTQEQSIAVTIQQLCECAETNGGRSDIANAVGEVEVNGVVYQIQLQLVCNRKLWIDEGKVRFQESTNINT